MSETKPNKEDDLVYINDLIPVVQVFNCKFIQNLSSSVKLSAKVLSKLIGKHDRIKLKIVSRKHSEAQNKDKGRIRKKTRTNIKRKLSESTSNRNSKKSKAKVDNDSTDSIRSKVPIWKILLKPTPEERQNLFDKAKANKLRKTYGLPASATLQDNIQIAWRLHKNQKNDEIKIPETESCTYLSSAPAEGNENNIDENTKIDSVPVEEEVIVPKPTHEIQPALKEKCISAWLSFKEIQKAIKNDPIISASKDNSDKERDKSVVITVL